MTRRCGAVSTYLRKIGGLCVWAMLALGAPQLAQAELLNIDSGSSSVTFGPTFVFCSIDASGQQVCPPAQTMTYPVSGQVDLQTSPYGDPEWGALLLVISPAAVESPALDAGLVLEQLVGSWEEGEFFRIYDVCSIYPLPGASCSTVTSVSPWTWSSASWNGRKLVWTGSQQADAGVFRYTITARVAAVPEPGTLLLALPLVGVMLARRRPTPAAG